MRDTAERALLTAGWSPGRSCDVSGIISLLMSHGYSTSKPVEVFLREFNGITINFVRNKRPDSIWFDAQRAITLADREWVTHYEERTKTSLAPIGYSNHEHLILMRSDEGGFYGAFDDFLCTLGPEADEMIENLILQEQELP